MLRTTLGLGLACWCVATVHAAADETPATPGAAKSAPMTSIQVAQKEAKQPQKGEGPKDKKDDKTAPPQIPDLTRSAPEAAEASRGPRPSMIGDLPPLLHSLVLVNVPSLAKLNNDGQTIDIPFNGQRAVRTAIAGRTGFKIAENESVLPQDRAFFTYNYYSNLRYPDQGASESILVKQKVTFQGREFDADIFIPGVSQPRTNLHRETLGFEKSFLDGSFSLGVRVPIFQQTGASEFADSDLGDLTFIAKFAPYIDRRTGSGISAGIAVTVPTGPTVQTVHGDVNSTIIQPFVGYQLSRDALLVYGFTAIAVPSDVEDVTLLFNDIGVGYRVFAGSGLIASVIPAVEAHVTTPLNHRAATDSVQGVDLVVITGGLHIGIGQRSLLTIGVATPVSGPRLFDVEGIAQFNFRF